MSIEKCINMSNQYRLHFEIKKNEYCPKKKKRITPFIFQNANFAINQIKLNGQFNR